MSRELPEWRGKTNDARIPDRVKLRVFEKFKGICPECTRKLQPGQWDCDHIVALINGGEHREFNLRPLCESPCHSRKTRQDVAEKSRSYRKRKANAGIKRRSTFACSRDTPWKKKIGGEVVRR